MHGNYRTAAGGGGDDGEQGRGDDAKACLFTFHIAARLQGTGGLVHAQRCQQRVALLLEGGGRDYCDHKEEAHRGQNRPALAVIAHHAAKHQAQRGGDQEDRQHLQQVAGGRGILERVGRVGVEEAATVGAQHLDGQLRGHGAHGQRLGGLCGGLGDRSALGVQHRLACAIELGGVVVDRLQRLHWRVRRQVLDYALACKHHGQHQRQGQQHPERGAGQVGPYVTDALR